MIEPTDEMREVAYALLPTTARGHVDVALGAVLTIVERDQAPTQDAYDRTVRALEKHRARADRAEALLRDRCTEPRGHAFVEPGMCNCRPGEGKHEFGVEGCQGYGP